MKTLKQLAQTDATAYGLRKKLKKYELVRWIAFIQDVFPYMKLALSILQARNLDLDLLGSSIDTAINRMDNLLANPQLLHCYQECSNSLIDGGNFKDSNKIKLSKRRGQTLTVSQLISASDEEVLEHLKTMRVVLRNLQEDLVVTRNYRAFSLAKLRKLENKELLKAFGVDEVVELVNYYARVSMLKGIDPFISAKVIDEWETFKIFINSYNASASVKDLLNFISPDAQDESALAIRRSFSQVTKLVELFYILPLTTVDCERGFSKQNIIKGKQRNAQGSERLASLMQLSINGQSECIK
jgi:hypothetical protein